MVQLPFKFDSAGLAIATLYRYAPDANPFAGQKCPVICQSQQSWGEFVSNLKFQRDPNRRAGL